MHLGRKLVNVAQKAKGRVPLRYEFEVVPFFVGELPENIGSAFFSWERGSKYIYTEPAVINHHTHAVFWKQTLRQQGTVYRDEGGSIHPKEYSFKAVQVLTRKSGKTYTKTIGKVKVDLAMFCTGEINPMPQEVFLQLQPTGKLKVSLRALWLKDAQISPDALTETSHGTHSTHRRGEGASQVSDDNEQDLEGFDPPSLARHSPLPPDHHSPPPPGVSARGVPSSLKGQGDFKLGTYPATAGRPRLPNELQEGFAVPLTPEEQAARDREERRRLEEIKKAEYNRMVEEVTKQVRMDMEQEELRRSDGHGRWSRLRSALCCCWPGGLSGGDRGYLDQQQQQVQGRDLEGNRLLDHQQI